MTDLHFAGYDFTSGPLGTRIHRLEMPPMSKFSIGDRVRYVDVNLLSYVGTVTKVEGEGIWVRWDQLMGAVKEWSRNLVSA